VKTPELTAPAGRGSVGTKDFMGVNESRDLRERFLATFHTDSYVGFFDRFLK
jgi:hypothetical protein